MATTVAASDKEAITAYASSQVKRKPRGAVLARGNKTLSTGRSTHLGGDLQAADVSERYVATLNAEIVAISEYLAKDIGNLSGCTMYLTSSPNWLTWKTIVALGLKRIVHYGASLDPKITAYAQKMDVEVVSVA